MMLLMWCWRFLLFALVVADAAKWFPSRAFVVLRAGGEELTLDEKVHAAMRKLGLEAPLVVDDDDSCKDGVCKSPVLTAGSDAASIEEEEEETTTTTTNNEDTSTTLEEDTTSNNPNDDTTSSTPTRRNTAQVAASIANDFGVDESLAWAALGATSSESDQQQRMYDEDAAREMIRSELEMIDRVPEDSASVQTLLNEQVFGDNVFLIRRALAFADGNLEDARAILQAEMDEQEEEEEEDFPTVTVDANFDPTAIDDTPSPQTPTPAPREDVIFEATTAQVFELVLQSPVPVLLDIYADWCGPCKALSPILEKMAIQSGGAFRLVKVNSDTEKPIAGTALQVSALPTIFGIRDGKILNSFQGMPKSEDMMRNFLMGLLIPGQAFDPPVSAADTKKYHTLTKQLIKIASTAAYPFSSRERLHERVNDRLDELILETSVSQAASSAEILRTLLSNVMKDPFEQKYRRINLSNTALASKIAPSDACMSILKSVGFVTKNDDNAMVLGEGLVLINVAPLSIARDAIDTWIDRKKYEVAKANRHAKDENDRIAVQEELLARKKSAEEDSEDEDDDEVMDENMCQLKVRLHGKKKLHDVMVHADEPVRTILQRIPSFEDDEDFQIICAAKRLVIKSENDNDMETTLRSYGFWPTASLVVKPSCSQTVLDSPKLKDRSSRQKKKRGGSHTMQSVGIYAKDDNAKGELIDGGGGALYEQDVTDDEEDVVPVTDDASDEGAGESEEE